MLQLLETQQELAVAVSADRKKDVMINQLDKVDFLFSEVFVPYSCSVIPKCFTKHSDIPSKKPSLP